MTVISLRNSTRDGELPPGTVDGFCPRCRRETVAAADDPRCGDCGVTLHPLSLPAVPRPTPESRTAAQAPQPAPKPAKPTVETVKPEQASQKPLRLRPSRQAMAWDRATDALLAEAEREERESEAAYQQAKTRYDAALKQAHKLRQLRELVRVDDEQPALPTPKIVTRPATNGKRWSRKHDACVNCGKTDLPHASKGRCQTCDSHWRRTGQERPITTTEDTTDGND